MKIILRIIVILLVAAIVAGGFYLAVNNTSLTSGSDMEGGQPPAMISVDGQNFQPMERPDGDREGGASLAGLSGMLVTIAKIAGITIVVLLLQKTILEFGSRKLNLAQR